MADIDIERQKASAWPWIVGITVLAIVAIAIIVLFRAKPDEPTRPGPPGADVAPGQTIGPDGAPPDVAADAAAVSGFIAHIATLPESGVAQPDQLTEAMDRLAAAVAAVGQSAAPERSAALRARADSVRLGDWRLPRQSLLVRAAFDDVVYVLAAVELQGRLPASQTASLRAAAAHLDPAQPLAVQRETLMHFLEEAARTLGSVRGGVDIMDAGGP
jgi:hypothetical protein